MSALLTPEQLALRDAAREFTRRELLPLANQLDPLRQDMPQDLIRQLGELGYFGITLPEEHGGAGLGCLEYCLITEELSRGWMSVASVIRPPMGTSQMNAAQRERYLPRVAAGELICAFSMSEPGTGSDISGLSTRARLENHQWLITGSKYWCTYADGADAIVVVARTDEPSDPRKPYQGLSAFMVEKPRGELPAGVQGSPIPKIGYFGWKTWELRFDDCRVPEDCLIGERGKAFYMVSSGLEVARAHTAARAIGLARGALEDAIAYAQERIQFQQPIAHFQAIRFKVAQMATQVEAARQLLHYVCRKIDTGERCDQEAAMVKLHATEMAERVCSEALQIHGGAGYTTHCAVERYWRDARLTKIFEGTSEIQMRVISDHIFGKA